MDDHDRFLFDLQGFITVPDALSPEQITELNAIMDEHIARDVPPDATSHRFGGLLDWGPAYRNLIDQPAITSCLREIVDERFRLDHVYADVIRSGKHI
ncbi:MAG: serine/threonine-protein phosphatase 2A activator, partial [Chloroflexi bacterium]|nr:serine/threonine-protein phosphatase 2A activator [Chloroflexota bacterium]